MIHLYENSIENEMNQCANPDSSFEGFQGLFAKAKFGGKPA